MERHLAAIFAADVAGYSRLMGEDEERTLAALQAHRREWVDPQIVKYRGRIANTAGDSLLVEFPSAVDAVRCATEIQRGMAKRNVRVPRARRIAFRIGINIGDVVAQGRDLLGDGVNIAARIEQMAQPGGVYVSGIVRDQVEGRVSSSFHDLGPQVLKNIAQPVEVCRVLWSAQETHDPLSIAAPAEPSATRRLLTWLALSAAGALLLSAGAWTTFQRGPAWFSSKRQPVSILVLPFDNLSKDPAQDYLVDALTAAVISDLSRISDATVISRDTTVTFKSKAFDTKAESKKMHVRYLLQGSVLRQDSQMRVDVQLIEGESGTHLWAEQFDRSREDLFAIQDEITGGLARALNLGLLRSDSRRPERLSPAALEAEDDALRGKSLLDGPAIAPASNREAIALLTRAIELDLDNATAWIGLALAHSRAAVFGWSESRDGSVRASLEAANRAISVAPENAEAFEQLSVSERAAGRIAESIAAAEKCISFNRNLAGCYDSLAQGVLDQGRFEDAIQWTARALELSPRDARANAWHTTISYAYLCLGNDVKSIEEAGFAIAAREKYPSAYLYLAAAYANQGNIAEAKNALNEWKTMGAPSWSIAKQREDMFGTNKDPQLVSTVERRFFSGLRKAGMPEE